MLRASRVLFRNMTGLTMRPRKPLVAIVGATGTGKSKLAVELAMRFGGEIVNSDAIQLYDGLPIITNKIPLDEQLGITHHLLGGIALDEPTWDVATFVKRALSIIEEIRSRGSLPILVGGSHYYVQALLFQDSIVEVVEHDDAEVFPILHEPTEVILQKLREVDPVMATRWHPKDRRKIQRSLEIWLRTGQLASEMYAVQLGKPLPHQCETADKSTTLLPSASQEPALRFDTLVFWVHASKAVLHSRLDSRVLEMVKEGLLDEIKCLDEFQLTAKEAGEDIDKTRGIWVAIGYKEFEQYRAAMNTGDDDHEKFLETLMRNSITRTQAATRRYSNHQIRWIRTKFLNATARSSASKNIFLLDGSDLSQWDKNVARSAVDVTEKFLGGEELPEPQYLSEAAKELLVPKGDDLSHTRELWFRRTCENCDVTAVTAKDWEKHVCSKRHRKKLAGILKRQNLESGRSLKPTDGIAPAELTHLEVRDSDEGSEPENTPIEHKYFF